MSQYNTFTNNQKHMLWLEDRKNRPFSITYNLVRRAGFTPDMVLDTLHHLAFAAAVMASDTVWDPNHPKFQEYSQRAVYPASMDVQHDEPCVQIYTDYFPVWVGEAIQYFELNVMTEETSALELVERFSEILDTQNDIDEINTRLKPETPPQSRQSAPNSHAAPRKGGTPPPDSVPETVPMQSTEYGMFFGDCTTEAKRYIKAHYGGQVVGFTVRKIVRNEINGKLEYEFYSGFNGGVSQYPMGRQKSEYIKDDRTQTLLETLDYNAARECEGEWRGWFYANVKPGNDGDLKMYLNLNALHGRVTDDSPEDYPDTEWEPAHATIEDRPDDVPF
jgi:hypothetical protein